MNWLLKFMPIVVVEAESAIAAPTPEEKAASIGFCRRIEILFQVAAGRQQPARTGPQHLDMLRQVAVEMADRLFVVAEDEMAEREDDARVAAVRPR
jgi:hypothetical protein